MSKMKKIVIFYHQIIVCMFEEKWNEPKLGILVLVLSRRKTSCLKFPSFFGGGYGVKLSDFLITSCEFRRKIFPNIYQQIIDFHSRDWKYDNFLITFIMVYTKNATIPNVYMGINRPMLFPFWFAWCIDPAPITGGRMPDKRYFQH